MATLIGPTLQVQTLFAGEMFRAVWNLLQNESGPELAFSEFSDRSIQVVGVFGGVPADRLVIEGSNQVISPTDWFVLTGSAGTFLNISKTQVDVGFGSIILEPTFWIRPRLVGGDGTTNLNIWTYLRRTRDRQ